MCTLTYLPLENEQYILTTNRDESPSRAHAKFPEYLHLENKNIIFPKEPKAGGTWIASSDNGTTVCLLNGAFEPHKYDPPYKISRGLVLLEAIECIKPDEFFKNYVLDGVEPFTMIVLFHDPELKVIEFRWDGKKSHLKEMDAKKPHIWVSAQLYTQEAIKKREEWFMNWLQNHPNYTASEILTFHEKAGDGDIRNDMVMDRGEVKTVSITSVVSSIGVLRIHFKNLLADQDQEICIAQNVNQAFSNHIL